MSSLFTTYDLMNSKKYTVIKEEPKKLNPKKESTIEKNNNKCNETPFGFYKSPK